MSARGQMTMRAVISRPADRSQTDGWGQKRPDLTTGFVEVGTVPCFAWSKASRRAVGASGKSAVVEDMRAMMPIYIDSDGSGRRTATDVKVGDQLEIRDRLSRVVFSGPVAVETITTQPGSHLELMLTRHR